MKGEKISLFFDAALVVLITIALGASFAATLLPVPAVTDAVLATLSLLGLLPVIAAAFDSLRQKRLSVDLLASIALIFSLLARQWHSAAFINLMLAFARIFDHITSERARRTIQGLMKYRVEKVRLKRGSSIVEEAISRVKPGDLAVVESGDRMPVDGRVVSGSAEADESSLTGESESVPKNPGDRVFTATTVLAGSLIVETLRVGDDTTLARIIRLVEEASRGKNHAERVADRFTQWYISLSLLASGVMYMLGLSANEILAVLLVICADDIAVAVPLSFTAAIARAARRGVIVKGSAAFETLSHMKYLLSDKTGTLTRGAPKVLEIRAHSSWTPSGVAERVVMGASESGHSVSRALSAYAAEHRIRVIAPEEFREIPGQGIMFRHHGEDMLLGRMSFLEKHKCRISADIRRDIDSAKDNGCGVAVLAVNGEAAGMVAYRDELRPQARELIARTKSLGVAEWHMLSGDNERAAAAAARELGIEHYHANMTPESKVEFIKKFEREHSGPKSTVGYMGDGVNDAAALALADVSIAMGGIGADAAIEAADITIMKDKLERLPETMEIGHKVMGIMRQNFGIWAVTNIAGLALVALGFLGPAGAAAYNFLTDFLPIGNALRAGRK